MALEYAGIEREHREIELKSKPPHMLEISPKGTVPVLMLPTGRVIDESFEIMIWAVSQRDPDLWLPDMHRYDVYDLIEKNDTIFKPQLDRYKYPNRYKDEDCTNARENGMQFLKELDKRITVNGYISGDKITLADIAIFPFIRQFAHVDKNWFYQQNIPALHNWLKTRLESGLFKTIMKKHPVWEQGIQ